MHKANLIEQLACALEDTKHEYQHYIDSGFEISVSDSFSAQKNNHGDEIIGIVSIEYYEPDIDYRVQTICEMASNKNKPIYHELYVGVIDKDCTEFAYVKNGFEGWATAVINWYSAINKQPLNNLQHKVNAIQRRTMPAINMIASTINNHLNQEKPA